MSTATSTLEHATQTCDRCEGRLVSGVCVNVSCDAAVESATADASRTTAKAGGRAAVVERTQPRAFNLSGNVD